MNCMKSFLEMQVARHRIGQNVESLGVALGKLLPQSQHPVILQTPVQAALKISLDLHPLHEPLPDHCIQHSAIIHPALVSLSYLLLFQSSVALIPVYFIFLLLSHPSMMSTLQGITTLLCSLSVTREQASAWHTMSTR